MPVALSTHSLALIAKIVARPAYISAPPSRVGAIKSALSRSGVTKLLEWPPCDFGATVHSNLFKIGNISRLIDWNYVVSAIGRNSKSTHSVRHMREEEQLTCLIGGIYDAALDPELWPDVLARVANFVGGHAGGIVSKNTISKASTPYYHFGVDPHYVEIYSETHSRFGPMTTLPCFDVEQIVSIAELVPYNEFCEGRFFHEWMRPQGWVDAANSVLEKSVFIRPGHHELA